MLIDDVTITIKAGDGGNGVVHFRRTGQTAKGGPDGGNGGNGGNVFVQGINDITGLQQFQFKKIISAENGIKGGRQNMFGKNGESSIVRIPLGTKVTDAKTQETWEIINEQTKILVARGGKGGRGNNEFKTPTDQAPYYAEKGEPGQQRTLHLVMSLIADIGLIGLPNAGKSSLLKELTNANPKIGNYPFTTLEPNLGVLESPSSLRKGDMGEHEKQIIIADIPGLIEGASKGKGLGIKFLKHVEKTTILIHCLDASDEDLLKKYKVVRDELESFSGVLAHKKEIILLTKTDLINFDDLKRRIAELNNLKKEILSTSIYDKDQIMQLKKFLLTTEHLQDK